MGSRPEGKSIALASVCSSAVKTHGTAPSQWASSYMCNEDRQTDNWGVWFSSREKNPQPYHVISIRITSFRLMKRNRRKMKKNLQERKLCRSTVWGGVVQKLQEQNGCTSRAVGNKRGRTQNRGLQFWELNTTGRGEKRVFYKRSLKRSVLLSTGVAMRKQNAPLQDLATSFSV